MTDSLLHRGPDSSGFWERGHCSLGHRRLKIIDLSDRAAQPMHSSDGRFVIVYNGELYNYKDLRRTLEARGVRFRSASDTEVLLNAFALDGVDALSGFNGIFAFAVWDSVESVLFAARDRMGVKPLYYACDNDRFLFASEIKALLQGAWPAALNERVVGEYLALGAVTGSDTLFRGVSCLPPGSWIEFTPGQTPKRGRYFSLTESGTNPRSQDAENADAVYSSLENAVERQLISDVPVGSMCSGGLDSSGLTSLSARRSHGINTYCIRIRGAAYDESAFSRQVSRHCGTRHHEIECSGQDAATLLGTLIWLHDQPLKHSNSLAIFQVSRLARESVTVLLSGEGADELFGGYFIHQRAHAMRQVRRLVPRGMLQLARWSSDALAWRGGQRNFTAALASSMEEFLVSLRLGVDPQLLRTVAPGVSVDLSARYECASAALKCSPHDVSQAAMLYDQLTYLPTLLDRQDKMCMGTSVESRVPYLDVDVVRIANSLPSKQKIRGSVDKLVLRQALVSSLPDAIVCRKKHGLGLPLREWLSPGGPLAHLVSQLQDGDLVRSGLVDRAGLARCLSMMREGSSLVIELIWNLVNLELWSRLFLTCRESPLFGELPAWREVLVLKDSQVARHVH